MSRSWRMRTMKNTVKSKSHIKARILSRIRSRNFKLKLIKCLKMNGKCRGSFMIMKIIKDQSITPRGCGLAIVRLQRSAGRKDHATRGIIMWGRLREIIRNLVRWIRVRGRIVLVSIVDSTVEIFLGKTRLLWGLRSPTKKANPTAKSKIQKEMPVSWKTTLIIRIYRLALTIILRVRNIILRLDPGFSMWQNILRLKRMVVNRTLRRWMGTLNSRIGVRIDRMRAETPTAETPLKIF